MSDAGSRTSGNRFQSEPWISPQKKRGLVLIAFGVAALAVGAGGPLWNDSRQEARAIDLAKSQPGRPARLIDMGFGAQYVVVTDPDGKVRAALLKGYIPEPKR